MTGVFEPFCGLPGEADEAAQRACEGSGNDSLSGSCTNSMYPSGMYLTQSDHPPVNLTAAAEVEIGFEDARCGGVAEVPAQTNNAGDYSWIHTFGGDVDFYFGICPFG
jgi:hypothetical protein